jgi:hypothetical protein
MADTDTVKRVTPEELRELLDYDPETGLLRWKPRPLKYFEDRGGRYTAERSKRIFDTMYANTLALNCPNENGYLRGNLFGRLMQSHRAAYMIMTGKALCTNEQIDHINGIRTDNRWVNLRLVTNTQNQHNSRSAKGSTSQFVGVGWDSTVNKWCAYICPENKKIHLGYFATELDAAIARDKAALKIFGEYARLNILQREELTT